MVEKEDGDLLVRLLADIHTAVNTVGRLIPIRLPRHDLEPMVFTTFAVLDGKSIAAHDHCYAMKWVTVPAHCLAGCEAQPTDEDCSTLEESLFRR